jgi:hypothetical protein
MGNQQKENDNNHLHRRFQWVERNYMHSIFIGRITQIYERRLKINTIGGNLLLDLHKMQNDIGYRCHSFWHQNNILKKIRNIFCNAFMRSQTLPWTQM